jgi:cadmium resistance protein CadD (predicted permease)
LALTGFIGWWSTGIDDVLALGMVLRGRSRGVRWAILVGNVTAVIILLALGSAVVLGAIRLAPGLLETHVLGIRIQDLGGLLPIEIGLRALYRLITRQADNDDDDSPPKSRWRTLGLAFVWGGQVYLLNAFDDLALHLGILGGAIHPPFTWAALLPVAAYWIGNLIGEGTSLVAARWIALHMQTRRVLEWIAALALIGIGSMVLLGVFG